MLRPLPIPLIMNKPSSWRTLGPAIAGAMCLGLLVFIFAFGSLPSSSELKNVLPLLPFVLIFAASNAFGEEMIYRAPWLCALENPIGSVQALLITAVYFGIAHFYGVPYGVLGVIMAFIPGWLMGKAMLETLWFRLGLVYSLLYGHGHLLLFSLGIGYPRWLEPKYTAIILQAIIEHITRWYSTKTSSPATGSCIANRDHHPWPYCGAPFPVPIR